MNFVGVKAVAQQEIMALHNDRARIVEERTALTNEIRALLLEHGITIPQGIHKIIPLVTELLDPEGEEITPMLKNLLSDMLEDFKHKGTLIKKRDNQLKELSKINSQVQQLMSIPNIGVIIATAFVSSPSLEF